ncbi:MAG: flagellar hook-length control protein FliK [Lachnospiraceae bacterium]|nr:flagellar hook-length control protein FliK [Lachnospiraceae bacterium]
MAINIDNNYQINDNLRPAYTPTGAGLSVASHRASSPDMLNAGSTVTGQIVDKEGDQVTIRLGNDQTISAKMQGNADIEVGTTMTFEVARGANGQTALRPLYSNLSAGSATLSALRAANLPINDTTVAMTDKMMSESMPVNRNALMEMFRNISSHQNASPETIVSMTKLGMPLTETNVIQYENYRNFEHQITNDLQEATNGVSAIFHEAAENGDTAVINEVLDLIDPESLETIAPDRAFVSAGTAALGGEVARPAEQAATLPGAGEVIPEVPKSVAQNTAESVTGPALAQGAEEAASEAKAAAPGEVAINDIAQPTIKDTVDSFIGGIRDMIMQRTDNSAAVAPESINANLSLTGAEQMSLASELQNILILAGQSTDIHEPLDPSQIMSAVKQLAQQYPPEVTKVDEVAMQAYSEEASESEDEQNLLNFAQRDVDSLAAKDSGKAALSSPDALPQPENSAESIKAQVASKLSDLIRSDGFTKLVKDSLTAQMSIRPKDVAEPGKIEELYDRIMKTSARISQMMESIGRGDSSVAKAAASLNDNVNFMNNLNEFVNYVQLPLKMAGEDANGELYVYTRKKDLSNKDGNYSALLHLDMEHLGPMDVYVTMRDHTKVNTTFYLASEKLLDFIEAHIDQLTKRLTDKGYDTGVRVTRKDPKDSPTPVADEFTREEPNEGSHMVVSKMRFDVRA